MLCKLGLCAVFVIAEITENRRLTGISLNVGYYAEYMVADAGKVWGLIHLPYGDAYEFPYIHKISKTEIKKQIKMNNKMLDI